MPTIEQVFGELLSVDTDQKLLRLRERDQVVLHENEYQYDLELTESEFFDLVGSPVICKLSDKVVKQIEAASVG